MEIKNLNEVCMINMGQSPDSSSYNDKKEGLAFYQGNADFGEIHPTTRVWCNNPIKIAEKDDILISVRAPIGSMNIANEKCCIGRGLASIKPIDKNECNQNYLYYFLESKVPYMQSKGTGSTFKAINKGILTSLQIKLPNIREQEKISSIISKIKAQIHNKKLQIRKYDELVKSQFIEMFENKNFETKKGFELFEFSSGKGQTTNCLSDKYNYPCYGGNGITGYSKEFFIDYPTIVIGRVGAYCGSIHFVNQKCWITDNAIYIKSIKNFNCNLNFMEFVFTNANFRRFSSSSGQPKITQEPLKNYDYILPPIELQNQFADFVKHIDKLKFTIKQSVEKLENCYNSLMQEYFE